MFKRVVADGGPVFASLPISSNVPNVAWTLVGIASYRAAISYAQNLSSTLPITKVDPYLDWIKSKMRLQEYEYCGQNYVFEKLSLPNQTEDTTPNSFPFLAILVSKGTTQEAVIITDLWIISGGAFFDHANRNETIVRYGVNDIRILEEGSSWTYISTVYFHPDRHRDKNIYSIAMSKLISKIIFTDFVQPVCLPMESFQYMPISSLFIIGLGTAHAKANMSVEMRMWQIRINRHECKDIDFRDSDSTFVCTTKSGEKEDICRVEGRIVLGKMQISKEPVVFGWTLLGLSRKKDTCDSSLEFYKLSTSSKWMSRIIHDFGEHADYCGRAFYEPVLGNGSRVGIAEPGSFPFVVALEVKNEGHACTGTLLNNNWVITARVCADGFNYLTYRMIVVAGVHDHKLIKQHFSSEIEYVITRNEETDVDIAMLKLASLPKWSNIYPICLPFEVYQQRTDYYAAGWGVINLKRSSIMMQMEINLTDIYQSNADDHIRLKHQFPTNSCLSDKGTPIFVKSTRFSFSDNYLWTLVGVITNNNSLCSRGSAVAIIITHPKTLSWIEDVMSQTTEIRGNCGVSTVDVINPAQKSLPGNWPWLVLVEGVTKCGGTLINKFTVLSTGYCAGMGAEYLRVLVGAFDKNHIDETVQSISLKAVRLHPGRRVWRNLQYDIALLTLNENVEFTKWIQPVCLPPKNFRINSFQDVFVVGYGFDSVPRHFRQHVIDTAVCQNILAKHRYLIPTESICLQGYNERVCRSDIGGPMLIRLRVSETNHYWIIYGVVTIDTCDEKKPAITQGVKIDHVRDWIEYYATA